MAKKERVEEVAVAEIATPTKYPLAKLRENCLKLFGVTSSTFDGATFNLKGEYTVEEAKIAIEKWKRGIAKNLKEAKN